MSKTDLSILILFYDIYNQDGKIIITMDGDLQNDPEEISALFKKMQEGYDVASG